MIIQFYWKLKLVFIVERGGKKTFKNTSVQGTISVRLGRGSFRITFYNQDFYKKVCCVQHKKKSIL